MDGLDNCSATAGAPDAASPKERLIAAARSLFCRNGVGSVGVDSIVEEAGTAKTTLYKLFGSKNGLVEAVLEREGEIWRAWFLESIDGPGGSPEERLHRIGPTLKRWFQRDDFFGCLFINTVGESDKKDDRMRSLAMAHKKIILDRLRKLCEEIGDQRAAETAHTIGMIIDGAIVATLITKDPDCADIATRAMTAVLAGTERARALAVVS